MNICYSIKCNKQQEKYCVSRVIWAEAPVIQEVADAFHLTISIVESNQGFAPCTAISPVAIPGHEPTVINIGHMDDIHYVSTIPYNDKMVETDLS